MVICDRCSSKAGVQRVMLTGKIFPTHCYWEADLCDICTAGVIGIVSDFINMEKEVIYEDNN